MIEQETIQQRQLEEQISFLQLTLASLQARQIKGANHVDETVPMSNDNVTSAAGAIPTGIPLAIAAG